MIENKKWKVLIVDDDNDLIFLTKTILSSYTFENKEVELFFASSSNEAKIILNDKNDIAIIIMDTVIENYDSGLKLVNYIRDDLKNDKIRILLRTEFPAEAIENSAIQKFDISDYELKIELTPAKLISKITTGLRSYSTLMKISDLEHELNSKNKIWNEVNESKNKLISIIAKDLKNPFNSILGISTLLDKNLMDFDIEKSVKLIDQINSTAKQTLNLLDNLLEWLKLQNGQTDFEPKYIALQSIFSEIVELLNTAASNKNITLNNFLSDDFMIKADKNMLQVILRNLISNAIKFTNSGGKVDIYAISDQNQIEITIKDNGIGIDEEKLNKLFTFKNTYTSAGTANEKGSGIGLDLCREFTQKHGGKIWVKSELGNGSEFHFTLPFNN